MFDKENRKEEGKLNTIIGKGTVIEGSLRVESSLRVEGKVKGRLSASDTLTVGPSGVVEAEVEVKNAIVGGKIIGNLKASQRVELGSKAIIEGDIVTKNLIIEEGATFDGRCLMKEHSPHQEGTEILPGKSERKGG